MLESNLKDRKRGPGIGFLHPESVRLPQEARPFFLILFLSGKLKGF